MKIVRHIAPDMRQAMRSIREQLGDDAVILSSRRIPEGVEVTAAIDFDATSLQGAMNAPAQTLTAAPLPTQPAAASRVLASSRTAPAPTPASAQTLAPSHAAVNAIPGAPYETRAPAYSHAAASHYFPSAPTADTLPFAHILGQDAAPPSARAYAPASAPTPAHALASDPTSARAPAHQSFAPVGVAAPHYESAAPAPVVTPAGGSFAPAGGSFADRSVADRSVAGHSVTPRREPTLNIPAPESQDLAAQALAELPAAAHANEAMGAELKMMRRMLETQLAQLAWNDMTRRAPVHVEILRELTEIGISQELSEYILKQLPEKVELGFARRFAIAGLSQYLLVTGDRWLENGGRVAFIGATGVGKTT
ncbi:MAG TPA: hypothetical protein VH209_05355, partial [Steroidobacteraceae bacterium]|nr:hypothetical protein [Steroidobacteraceae bacterium]